MSEFGYFDYAKLIEQQQLAWAAGEPMPFVAEALGSMANPAPHALLKVATAKDTPEKYAEAYRYAFARDFAHRHRTGSSFLLKAGFTGTALPAAIRASRENVTPENTSTA